MTFLATFLGCLFALIAWALLKETFSRVVMWNMRRKHGLPELSGLGDMTALREKYQRERDAEMAAERKRLAKAIAAELRTTGEIGEIA